MPQPHPTTAEYQKSERRFGAVIFVLTWAALAVMMWLDERPRPTPPKPPKILPTVVVQAPQPAYPGEAQP
jgi:hypothetical protein